MVWPDSGEERKQLSTTTQYAGARWGHWLQTTDLPLLTWSVRQLFPPVICVTLVKYCRVSLIFRNFIFNFLSAEVEFNHKSRHQAISKAQVDNNDMSGLCLM